ncbi:Smr/MutS family protein [Nitrosospira sp. Is2]|uniref:Smr/MutS family protein n=1 Tax=Nitrosospira sp. Is2 TaxID=3080532 RepID=UPI00295408EB|nr:Smr/MutS family protein [Nitrosospira sp. Is2]WON75308.1 Smr/MutS family protein [Nitrosospira sp. Is2]
MKRRDKKPAFSALPGPASGPANGPAGTSTKEPAAGVGDNASNDDGAALFRQAVQGVSRLTASDKAPLPSKHPPPIPRQIPAHEQSAGGEALSDHIALEIGAGDEWAFLRPGVSRQTLRRLRRGYWKIEAQLDLHGFTREEARQELAVFLDESSKRRFRCVRVIHGKGLSSPNHEPVLKTRVGNWLAQRADVLAFCQARPEEGGSGAVLVLLAATGK